MQLSRAARSLGGILRRTYRSPDIAGAGCGDGSQRTPSRRTASSRRCRTQRQNDGRRLPNLGAERHLRVRSRSASTPGAWQIRLRREPALWDTLRQGYGPLAVGRTMKLGCPVMARLRPTAWSVSPRWRTARRRVGACRSRPISFPRCSAPRRELGPCRPSRTRSPSQWRLPESAPAPVRRPAEAPQLRARRAR